MPKINIEILRPLLAKSPELLKRLKRALDKKYGNGDGKLNVDDIIHRLNNLTNDELNHIISVDDELLHQLEVSGVYSSSLNLNDIPSAELSDILGGSPILDDWDDIDEDACDID